MANIPPTRFTTSFDVSFEDWLADEITDSKKLQKFLDHQQRDRDYLAQAQQDQVLTRSLENGGKTLVLEWTDLDRARGFFRRDDLGDEAFEYKWYLGRYWSQQA
jgi:hypothetical protein